MTEPFRSMSPKASSEGILAGHCGKSASYAERRPVLESTQAGIAASVSAVASQTPSPTAEDAGKDCVSDEMSTRDTAAGGYLARCYVPSR